MMAYMESGSRNSPPSMRDEHKKWTDTNKKHEHWMDAQRKDHIYPKDPWKQPLQTTTDP